MKKFVFILSLIVVSVNSNAQIIISPDTSVCGIYNDTLQALSQELSSINTDHIHGAVAVPLGFTFNFSGTAYNPCVLCNILNFYNLQSETLIYLIYQTQNILC